MTIEERDLSLRPGPSWRGHTPPSQVETSQVVLTLAHKVSDNDREVLEDAGLREREDGRWELPEKGNGRWTRDGVDPRDLPRWRDPATILKAVEEALLSLPMAVKSDSRKGTVSGKWVRSLDELIQAVKSIPLGAEISGEPPAPAWTRGVLVAQKNLLPLLSKFSEGFVNDEGDEFCETYPEVYSLGKAGPFNSEQRYAVLFDSDEERREAIKFLDAREEESKFQAMQLELAN